MTTKNQQKPDKEVVPRKLPRLKDEDVCTKKKSCSNPQPTPFVNLSDFTGTYCRSCITPLTYEKVKPLKKGEELPKSATYEQPKAKPAQKPIEPEKIVQPATPIAANPEKQESPKTFTERMNEPAMEGTFPLSKAEHVKGIDSIIHLTFVTEHGEEFPVMVTTDPEKVKKIVAASEQFRGRQALIEFMGWDNELPMAPRFKKFL